MTMAGGHGDVTAEQLMAVDPCYGRMVNELARALGLYSRVRTEWDTQRRGRELRWVEDPAPLAAARGDFGAIRSAIAAIWGPWTPDVARDATERAHRVALASGAYGPDGINQSLARSLRLSGK